MPLALYTIGERPAPLAAFEHQLFRLGNGLGRIRGLRTGIGAVHDSVAPIQAEWILEIVQPLAGFLVAAVGNPAIRLKQNGRAEIAVRVPPIGWAAGRAAEAQDAFPQAVEPLAFLGALQALLVRRRRVGL